MVTQTFTILRSRKTGLR